MPVATALLIAGAVIGAAGAIASNEEKSNAEKQNADFYNEQASFAAAAGKRKMQLASEEADQVVGNETAAFGKAGVSMSGSALLAIEETRRRAKEQQDALQAQTDQDVLEARLKGSNSQDRSDTYGSFGYNALSSGGSILTGAGNVIKSKA